MRVKGSVSSIRQGILLAWVGHLMNGGFPTTTQIAKMDSEV